ncbi:uncharacterized protein [Ciconia boyciana]|uniref:uncharacterized protein n=1 Tax=Ciconia boyciana TaxID=52775 RepID=UPI003BA229CF
MSGRCLLCIGDDGVTAQPQPPPRPSCGVLLPPARRVKAGSRRLFCLGVERSLQQCLRCCAWVSVWAPAVPAVAPACRVRSVVACRAGLVLDAGQKCTWELSGSRAALLVAHGQASGATPAAQRAAWALGVPGPAFWQWKIPKIPPVSGVDFIAVLAPVAKTLVSSPSAGLRTAIDFWIKSETWLLCLGVLGEGGVCACRHPSWMGQQVKGVMHLGLRRLRGLPSSAQSWQQRCISSRVPAGSQWAQARPPAQGGGSELHRRRCFCNVAFSGHADMAGLVVLSNAGGDAAASTSFIPSSGVRLL